MVSDIDCGLIVHPQFCLSIVWPQIMRGRRLHIATRDEDRLGAGDTVIELQYQDQNGSVQLSPPLEWTTPPLTKKHRLKRIFSLKKIRRENGRSRWEVFSSPIFRTYFSILGCGQHMHQADMYHTLHFQFISHMTSIYVEI